MFLQLTKEDCAYLLRLIETLDSTTPHTARQRTFTIPKLQQIAYDPLSARLAYQDVRYLLDLLEDYLDSQFLDSVVYAKLLEIRKLQDTRWIERQQIDRERAERRAHHKTSIVDLKEHFQGPEGESKCQ